MRRSLAVVGASVVALLCITSTASAAESIPDGDWAGSALEAGPTAVEGPSYTLSGTFQHVFNRQVEVTISASSAGTGACAVAPTTLPRAEAPRAFNVTLTIPCNGTYTLVASAITTDDNAFFVSDSARLDRTVAVAAPAPTVTGVQATADGRTATVTWDRMVDNAPDLTGYILERKVGEDPFLELATVDAHEQSYEDSDLPAEGGEATYRVFATRPSPDGDKVSAASDEAATTFSAAPDDTTDTTGPDGATGGTEGTGGADGSGSTSSGDRASPPRVFSGTFLPPLLRPAAQTIGEPTTPNTADTGFDESLPYEQGEEDPVLPNDAMASIFTGGQPGRGMAIPVATALVLAIWAFHLRMLARAARPHD